MAKKASFNFSMSSRSPEERAALKAKIAAIHAKNPPTTAESVSNKLNSVFGGGPAPRSISRSSDARGRDPATQVRAHPLAGKSQAEINAEVQRVMSLETPSGALGANATREDALLHSRISSIRHATRNGSGALPAGASKEDAMLHSAVSSIAAGGSPVGNVGTKSAGKIGSGGGVDDQPRDEQGRWV